MKLKIFSVLICLTHLFAFQSMSQTIKKVKIGDQVWMSENLNVDHFRNGEVIPEAKTAEEWKKAAENHQPAWCYYDNNPSNGDKYGKLYNWYAVNDPRGLAPKGWHIPADDEWSILINHLGGTDVAGKKLKSKIGWEKNGNGTDEFGFSGLPGGTCYDFGPFIIIGIGSFWWSSTEDNKETTIAWNRALNIANDVVRYSTGKGYGASVRCIRD